VILLEYGFKGPLREGYWQATNAETKSKVKITGKQASMISMILSGYVFKDDFMPFDAFTEDSMADGRPLMQQATAQDSEKTK
jgi:hypothetical protein